MNKFLRNFANSVKDAVQATGIVLLFLFLIGLIAWPVIEGLLRGASMLKYLFGE